MMEIPKQIVSEKSGHRVVKNNDPTLLRVQLLDLPSRLPVTPIEKLAIATLKDQGPTPFHALVERVAHEVYLDEIRNGAGVLDIGLFGSRLFTRDVTRELKAGDGILWKIK